MKFPFKLPRFKSKKRKWKEKLMKDYEEGKVLKVETPNPHQDNNNNQNNKDNHNNQNNNHAHNQKNRHKKWRN